MDKPEEEAAHDHHHGHTQWPRGLSGGVRRDRRTPPHKYGKAPRSAQPSPRDRQRGTPMKLGLSLPHLGRDATPEKLVDFARRTESLGFDSLWVLERLLRPVSPKNAPAGKFALTGLPEDYGNVFDPIETLTYVAAHTRFTSFLQRHHSGTSLAIFPMRPPVYRRTVLSSPDTKLVDISEWRLLLWDKTDRPLSARRAP